VAKSAKFRWVIQVECNIQKGAVFNPRKALLWLLGEVWKVDRGAIISCAKAGGKDRLVRDAKEYPHGQDEWMEFFPYVAKDLFSGGMTVCTGFKIESVLMMESFKKPDMLEKLKARNMFIEKHNFESFDLQPIGFFVGKCPRLTDKVQFERDIIDATANALNYIVLDDDIEGEGVPTAQIGYKRVYHECKYEDGSKEKIYTHALELKCEKQAVPYMKEVLMKAKDYLPERKFGKFVPYSMQSESETFEEMIAEQNEFIDELAHVYIMGVHEEMMDATLRMDGQKPMSLRNILLAEELWDAQSGKRVPCVRTIEKHFKYEQNGQWVLVTTEKMEQHVNNLADVLLDTLSKHPEARVAIGPFRMGRMKKSPSGAPIANDRTKRYATAIGTVKGAGSKRKGFLKAPSKDKKRSVVIVWGDDDEAGQGEVNGGMSGGSRGRKQRRVKISGGTDDCNHEAVGRDE
jgi:hypothetical protein